MLNRYLTENEIENFFNEYLKLFNIDGYRDDYFEISNWHLTGKYPDCFDQLWEVPVGKQYGYHPIILREAVAKRLAFEICNPNNYNSVMKSYIKKLAENESKKRKR